MQRFLLSSNNEAASYDKFILEFYLFSKWCPKQKSLQVVPRTKKIFQFMF